MKRATKDPSKIFQKILEQAQQRLHIDANGALNLSHNGLRGDHRADVLSELIKSHLPTAFSVSSGELIDSYDGKSGQIDLCIVDTHSCAPVQSQGVNSIIPAEAVYAIIEVKSVLSQEELTKCFRAAKRIRDLRPFKKRFVGAARKGAAADGNARCPYIVFAFSSNLSNADWPQKEMDRVMQSTVDVVCDVDLIDIVVVLDRGILYPAKNISILPDNANLIFLDFYIHLMNFLMREWSRRPKIDWMTYGSRPFVTKLKPRA